MIGPLISLIAFLFTGACLAYAVVQATINKDNLETLRKRVEGLDPASPPPPPSMDDYKNMGPAGPIILPED